MSLLENKITLDSVCQENTMFYQTLCTGGLKKEECRLIESALPATNLRFKKKIFYASMVDTSFKGTLTRKNHVK
jgi:hypothetical protein